MKYLTQFQTFDMDAFLNGKQLMVTGVSELVDFDTKNHLGTKVEVAIVKDNTQYKQKAGEQKSNRFEKMTIKVLKDMQVPIDAIVLPVDVTAKVYGPYSESLSVTAKDLKIATPKQA